MSHRLASGSRIALLTCVVVCGGTIPVAAQVNQPPPVQVSVGVVGSTSVGEFGTFVPEGAGGFLLHVDARLGDSIFSVGGEIGWKLYGDQTRTVPLSPLIPELPQASIDINTTNAMLPLYARVRAQTRQGRWRPYADGLIGLVTIYTTSAVGSGGNCDESSCSGIDNDRQTHSRDWVLSYGGGGGVMIAFSSREHAPRLDVAIRYLRGGRARYLTEGALRIDGGRLIRDFSTSRTDMVDLYIGVAFGR